MAFSERDNFLRCLYKFADIVLTPDKFGTDRLD